MSDDTSASAKIKNKKDPSRQEAETTLPPQSHLACVRILRTNEA